MTVKISNGKITASKEVLNSISLTLNYAADTYDFKGMHSTAKVTRTDSHLIYEKLDEIGFYG